jgi:uncharacterized protein (DUF3820 family)
MSGLNLEKSKKLLALALDRSGQPEGDVAAVMFVKELKRSGITLDHLVGGAIPEEPPKRPKPPKEKEMPLGILKAVKLPFGKHKGECIWDVAQTDRDYLVWMSESVDFKSPTVKDAILKILELVPDGDGWDEGEINLGD